MPLLNIINNYFSVTQLQFFWSLLFQLAAIAGLFLVLRAFKPKWARVGYLVLLVWLVRCLLFGSQYSWGLYYQKLSVDDVGWRQQSAINVEYYKFFKYPGRKYLAVGSSQTYSLYHEYSKKHPQVTVFNLAGMTPIDFYLYRDYIAARNVEYILLFLSEFDMSKEPSLNAAKIAPPQGLEFWRHLSVYGQVAKLAGTELALKEMAAGEFFPEYKYSFMFKGLLQKYSGKNDALRIRSLYENLRPDSMEKLRKEIIGTHNQMQERWIGYQAYFLEKFFEYCRSKSLKVIVVEGQYNPLVRNEAPQRLNALARAEIIRLVGKFENTRYVPTKDAFPLLEADFEDSVHVQKESAGRFVDALLRHLGR